MQKSLFTALLFCLACQSKTTKIHTFFIGTYTQKEGHVNGKGDGIYKMTFDPATLDLKITDTIKGMTNPSFLALSNDNFKIFAVNEIGPGTSNFGKLEIYGTTTADFGTKKSENYGIGSADFGQKLAAASTESHAPCHVVLDKNGRTAVVSNYLGGVSVFQLPLKNGAKPQFLQFSISPGAKPKTSPRQENSHPHSAIFSPDNRFVFVADLGTDRIMQFQFDAAGQKLVPAETPFFELPDGCGPRHLAFSNDGKWLYALCELSNEVAVLQVLENGNLKKGQIIGTLPANFQGENSAADIHVSKNGHFLYTSNRGDNSIAVFKMQMDGSLKRLGHVDCGGKIPRNFHLTNDGNWMLVAGQNSNNIALFDLRYGDLPVFVKSISVATPVAVVEQ